MGSEPSNQEANMGEIADMMFEQAIADGTIFDDIDSRLLRERLRTGYESTAQAASRRIRGTRMRQMIEEGGEFWMLMADPGVLTRDSHGNARITSEARAPRSIFTDESRARRVAAKLAAELDCRIFVLKCVDSCVMPEPEPPPVEWASAARALVDTEGEGS